MRQLCAVSWQQPADVGGHGAPLTSSQCHLSPSPCIPSFSPWQQMLSSGCHRMDSSNDDLIDHLTATLQARRPLPAGIAWLLL